MPVEQFLVQIAAVFLEIHVFAAADHIRTAKGMSCDPLHEGVGQQRPDALLAPVVGLVTESLHQGHSPCLKGHAQLVEREFLCVGAPEACHLIGCNTAGSDHVVRIIQHVRPIELKTIHAHGSQCLKLLVQPVYSRGVRQIQGSGPAVPPLCDERLSVRIFDENIHGLGLTVLQGVRGNVGTDPEHDKKAFAVKCLQHFLRMREFFPAENPFSIVIRPAVIDHEHTCRHVVFQNVIRITENVFFILPECKLYP